MNALTLHQVMSAITAIANPPSVARRCSGVNSSARRGCALRLRGGCFQRSGSLHEHADDERDRRRDRARRGTRSATTSRARLEQDARDPEVDERREEQPHRRRRVEQRARFDAPLFGHDLGDHRRARGPLAADAQAGDDAERDQHPDVGAPRARRGAERVQQHREQQRARAPDAIGDLAEQDAARGPAESRIDVRMPVHLSVAAFAAGEPIGRPSSVGTQFGAT